MRSGSVLKPVFIESARSYLPSSFERTAEAVANGTVLGATAARSGVAQLPVEHDLSAPEMAVQAAKSALLDSAVSADELEAIFYASTFFQGATFWSPAHFIAEARRVTDISEPCRRP
ncbi:hypothetical protein C5E10_08715 [Pseudoclavibacter sp. RFBG4]|uniref:hypothetical protein n=1 Tax=Pseudoclavibacter sp. RFBG4 TaxID=2080575 RepID=UPI000CE8348D|nr:hypothetical protein [Pseudoclavibacter sp. RFBG4]PPG33873.1 hypothetical protein C5E10_08715 [Pseudoclavibacter sp. RFBG4]